MTTSGKQPMAKQVVYVDVDDEITAIIDKMNASDAKVVALVLPKRASVFQSVVNMKLLKRRADAAKKHIVLITSEASLMPLAGMAGVHVAPTLQSKPRIPLTGLVHPSDGLDDEAVSADEDFDAGEHAGVAVGALANGAPASAATVQPDKDTEDVIELDNTAKDGPLAAKDPSVVKAAPKNKKTKKDHKLKVPNFFSFRKRLILGGLALIAAVAGWYYAFNVMPKAAITIETKSSDVSARLPITLDTAVSKTDSAKMIMPAQTKQEQKSNTGQATATGQQNKGEKATGSVTLSIACTQISGAPPTVPAGTGISTNGLTFITQKSVDLSKPSFSGGCHFTAGTAVIAEKPGTAYNVKPSSFTVAGFSEVTGSSDTAFGGGTDNMVKVIQQSDIDAARQKLTSSADQDTIKRQLSDRLQQDGLYPVPATFYAGPPNENISGNVGDEAETVTVTQSVTYTMFGVKEADLKTLVDAEVHKKIGNDQLDILDDGLANAKITVGAASAGPQQVIDVAIVATAGPKVDTEALKRDIVGLKSGIVKDRIKQLQGVEDADVEYSPFWVTKAPKADKITVQFEKSSAKGTADGG